VAVYFIGETDANTEPRGIDASYEPFVSEQQATGSRQN
jgi:hypothetical protein